MMLPSNLADWPPGEHSAGAEAANRRRRGRSAAKLVVLVCLGTLIGIGVFRWSSPDAPVNRLPQTLDPGVAPPSPATPEAASQPELDVTGLLGDQAESQNWAGYAAADGGYTAVSATWTLPQDAPSLSSGVDATWVGIGGVRSRDLIQAGTQRTVSTGGAIQREAWIEILPRPSHTVPLTLGAGDSISVSITQQGPETWLIAFTDTTSGQSYQVTQHYASSLSSVEWVEEAPSAGRGRPLPLDDFGTVRFSAGSTVVDDQVLTIAQTGAHPITMITPGGLHLVEPSVLGADGASFSVVRTTIPSPRRRP
jgi:hypothetical protein